MTELRFPWDGGPAPAGAAQAVLPSAGPPPRPRGRRPAAASARLAAAAAPPWLHHHLTISESAALVTGFSEAARGPGVLPWQLDGAAVEEDIFNLAAPQPPHRRTLTVEGCRILVRQFRQRVEAYQAKATALAGSSRACSFDLHTLLPVPDAVLRLGPTHPPTRTPQPGCRSTGARRTGCARCSCGRGRQRDDGCQRDTLLPGMGSSPAGTPRPPRSGSCKRAGPGCSSR